MAGKKQVERKVTSARIYRDSLPRLNTLKYTLDLGSQEDVLEMAVSALETQTAEKGAKATKP